MGKTPSYPTLGEYVYELVSEHKTTSQEFLALMKYYGREKLKALYVLERERKKTLAPIIQKTHYQKAIHDA
jgi:hypothetical protein